MIFNEASRSGLATKFETFQQNIAVSEAQKQNIIGSHTHMRQNVLDKLNYVKSTFLTGSYKKNTMIKPINDVDMFVVLNYSSAGDITPQAALNKLKNDLKNSYPNSTIKQDKPCVVAEFNHAKFELTPVIEFNGYSSLGVPSKFYIPKIEKNYSGVYQEWIYVEDPRDFEQRLSQTNANNSGKLTPLIKMLKKCRDKNGFKMKSFELEQKVIQKFNYGGISSYRQGVQDMLGYLNWTFNNYSIWKITGMTDDEFARFARETLFGNDFPA